MKYKEVLEWIVKQSINGEFLNFVEVPDEYDEFTPQTEEWWQNFCGACPPAPIAAGKYLYYYDDSIDSHIENESGVCQFPDAEVEVEAGKSYINFYLLED